MCVKMNTEEVKKKKNVNKLFKGESSASLPNQTIDVLSFICAVFIPN